MNFRKFKPTHVLNLLIGFLLPYTVNACTSLLYSDLNNSFYAGRTMELPMELDYQITLFPRNFSFESKANNHAIFPYSSNYSFIAVTIPDPFTKDLKVAEGLNEHGLSFSVLAFASTEGPKDMIDKTVSALAAIDIGSWALSQFKSIDEVKLALDKKDIIVTALLPLGKLKTPFHYTLHDATGKSIVIEYFDGKQNIIDNTLGVLTNGPEFNWHLTNLNNYTHLTNIDSSKSEFNGVKFTQPDSGIATSSLPASNTSVGRFVRAVYYSNFSEKGKTPSESNVILAHIMNNFDRPRGATIDSRLTDELSDMTAPGLHGKSLYTSEYTSWTSLEDLSNLEFRIKSYNNLNYTLFDLKKLASQESFASVKLKDINDNIPEGTNLLLKQ